MPTIAFTYDLGTSVGQARLYAGDTDPAGLSRSGGDRTRTDDEITYLLGQNGGNPRLAAAAILEGKAAEFAALASNITQGSLRQDFRFRSRRMLEAAVALRGSAGAIAGWNAPANPDAFTGGPGGTMDGW